MSNRALGTVLATAILLAAALVAASVASALPKPEFRLGFKELADQIPDLVGDALENEHWAANGDSLQSTTGGMLVWRKADNWTAFTDGNLTWINGPYGIQSRSNDRRYSWEDPTSSDSQPERAVLDVSTPTPTAVPAVTPTPTPPPAPRIATLNDRFLLLNMHGALFHPDIKDLEEDVKYAQWMNAGVIRVFATDNNTEWGRVGDWDGKRVGNRIADAAPAFRAARMKLLVALVNNHRPAPNESPDSYGMMDGYKQLLLPFYTTNWRGAYLTFVRDIISTVVQRGAQDVIFAWELGNELHTPQDPKAIIPFITQASEEIRRLDPKTPILPGTMGVNHLEPWNVRSSIARWVYCDAPIDAYTVHAYDWVSKERPGDMPIQWDLDYTTVEPCSNGRKLPVIVEELGTSRELGWEYAFDQEQKRLEQEKKQIRFVLGYRQVIGLGSWSSESPKLIDNRTFHDSRRGLTSYGTGALGGGSCYDPRPDQAASVRCQLEQVLQRLPAGP